MALHVFHPIAAGDKIEQIVQLLKDLIINEELRAGSELPPERQLAAQLRVSRYSLREALRAAQAHGLIELRQGRRARVSQPSTDAATTAFGIALRRSKVRLSELITARISLECDIAAIAARNNDAALICTLEETIEAMASNAANIPLCVEEDLRFHDALVISTNNMVFKTMLDSVAHYLRASREATLQLTGVERALVGHRNIVAAIKAGDCQAAHDAMQQHLEMAEDDIAALESALV